MKRINVAPLKARERGLRVPAFEGVGASGAAQLYPFFVSPVLPGETSVGGVVSGMVRSERMMAVNVAPTTYTEIGVWYVPISSLPNWMMDTVINDAEDGALALTTDAPAAQGLRSHGKQTVDRPWAGEIGGDEAVANGGNSSFVPWTSQSVYRIADTWYEPEYDNASGATRADDDLALNVPLVGELIRSPLPAGIQADAGLDLMFDDTLDVDFNRSVGEWAERLTVLSRADRTYAEYLASHGIDPRRLDGIPIPLANKIFPNRIFSESVTTLGGPLESANIDDTIANLYGTTTRNTGSAHQFNNVLPEGNNTDVWMLADLGGLGMYGSDFVMPWSGQHFIQQPGFIVGTILIHDTQTQLGQYSEHIAANRMLAWPEGGLGGYDELEFLTAQELWTYETIGGNTSLASGEEGRSSNRFFNLMNLFLHGDTFNNRRSVDYFVPRGPLGNDLPASLGDGFRWQTMSETAVLSHLVNAT